MMEEGEVTSNNDRKKGEGSSRRNNNEKSNSRIGFHSKQQLQNRRQQRPPQQQQREQHMSRKRPYQNLSSSIDDEQRRRAWNHHEENFYSSRGGGVVREPPHHMHNNNISSRRHSDGRPRFQEQHRQQEFHERQQQWQHRYYPPNNERHRMQHNEGNFRRGAPPPNFRHHRDNKTNNAPINKHNDNNNNNLRNRSLQHTSENQQSKKQNNIVNSTVKLKNSFSNSNSNSDKNRKLKAEEMKTSQQKSQKASPDETSTSSIKMNATIRRGSDQYKQIQERINKIAAKKIKVKKKEEKSSEEDLNNICEEARRASSESDSLATAKIINENKEEGKTEKKNVDASSSSSREKTMDDKASNAISTSTVMKMPKSLEVCKNSNKLQSQEQRKKPIIDDPVTETNTFSSKGEDSKNSKPSDIMPSSSSSTKNPEISNESIRIKSEDQIREQIIDNAATKTKNDYSKENPGLSTCSSLPAKEVEKELSLARPSKKQKSEKSSLFSHDDASKKKSSSTAKTTAASSLNKEKKEISSNDKISGWLKTPQPAKRSGNKNNSEKRSRSESVDNHRVPKKQKTSADTKKRKEGNQIVESTMNKKEKMKVNRGSPLSSPSSTDLEKSITVSKKSKKSTKKKKLFEKNTDNIIATATSKKEKFILGEKAKPIQKLSSYSNPKDDKTKKGKLTAKEHEKNKTAEKLLSAANLKESKTKKINPMIIDHEKTRVKEKSSSLLNPKEAEVKTTKSTTREQQQISLQSKDPTKKGVTETIPLEKKKKAYSSEHERIKCGRKSPISDSSASKSKVSQSLVRKKLKELKRHKRKKAIALILAKRMVLALRPPPKALEPSLDHTKKNSGQLSPLPQEKIQHKIDSLQRSKAGVLATAAAAAYLKAPEQNLQVARCSEKEEEFEEKQIKVSSKQIPKDERHVLKDGVTTKKPLSKPQSSSKQRKNAREMCNNFSSMKKNDEATPLAGKRSDGKKTKRRILDEKAVKTNKYASTTEELKYPPQSRNRVLPPKKTKRIRRRQFMDKMKNSYKEEKRNRVEKTKNPPRFPPEFIHIVSDDTTCTQETNDPLLDDYEPLVISYEESMKETITPLDESMAAGKHFRYPLEEESDIGDSSTERINKGYRESMESAGKRLRDIGDESECGDSSSERDEKMYKESMEIAGKHLRNVVEEEKSEGGDSSPACNENVYKVSLENSGKNLRNLIDENIDDDIQSDRDDTDSKCNSTCAMKTNEVNLWGQKVFRVPSSDLQETQEGESINSGQKSEKEAKGGKENGLDATPTIQQQNLQGEEENTHSDSSEEDTISDDESSESYPSSAGDDDSYSVESEDRVNEAFKFEDHLNDSKTKLKVMTTPEKKKPKKTKEIYQPETEEERKRKKSENKLTKKQLRSILREDPSGKPSSNWVRRSCRQPCKAALKAPSVRLLLKRLKTNDPEVVILKMKRYINDPSTPQVIIDAALDALEENTNCEALYIQNFNIGMCDEQVLRLLKILQHPTCKIWCLNIGETYNVKFKTWKKFARGLRQTKITHMYASEHTIDTELKDKIRGIIRDNRKKHDMHNNPENLDTIIQCTHCWWNPINSKSLRPYLKTKGYEHMLFDKEGQGLQGSTSGAKLGL